VDFWLVDGQKEEDRMPGEATEKKARQGPAYSGPLVLRRNWGLAAPYAIGGQGPRA